MTGRPRREAGFTLIEMIVVLVLAGLMIGLFVARGPLVSRTLTAKAAAAELASGLREARARAIGSNQSVSLTLDLKDRFYRIGDQVPHKLPPGFDIALLTVAGEARKGKDPGIRFDPDGSSTGGRIVLSDAQRKLEVGVDWLTGRVRIVDAK